MKKTDTTKKGDANKNGGGSVHQAWFVTYWFSCPLPIFPAYCLSAGIL